MFSFLDSQTLSTPEPFPRAVHSWQLLTLVTKFVVATALVAAQHSQDSLGVCVHEVVNGSSYVNQELGSQWEQLGPEARKLVHLLNYSR